MQIDFHHTATYVVARAGGLSHADAATVAHAAQYVDDATTDGEIFGSDGIQLYRRLASAHRMLDYRNLLDLRNHLCWIPFHFLPGNCGHGPEEACAAPMADRLICLPNSPVAQDMMRAALSDKDKPYGPHRLGIAAHTFIDTFAHQQFAGIDHDVNTVNDLRWINPEGSAETDDYFYRRRKEVFTHTGDSAIQRMAVAWRRSEAPWPARLMEMVQHIIQGKLPTLGHGQALSYPDRPYARWQYVNGRGETVRRDNPTDFIDACDALCRWFQRWSAGDAEADVPGLPANIRRKIEEMIRATDDPDGHNRHRNWLDAIRGDFFGFGPEELTYVGKGHGSWKQIAVGNIEDVASGKEIYEFGDVFRNSDWKRFHDAAKAHRREILDDILPRHGIIAA
ncbi:MAG: DUF6765 family protein [Alphaproteobacteria bacterium]|nr:DUF6765 family protein [Alphaproteobacteria bacterium]